jgi:hypothetical protein
LCRFCRGAVEDERHALLICDGNPDLQLLRRSFLQDMEKQSPSLFWEDCTSLQFLTAVIREVAVQERVAKYVYDVFSVFRTAPIFRPAPYMYAPF